MAIADLAMLREAIAVQAPAVMAFTANGRTMSFRTRFRMDGGSGFAIVEPYEVGVLADSLIRGRTAVMVAFRRGPMKVMLTSVLLRRETIALSDGALCNAVVVEYPQDLAAMQRREFYRAHIPEGCEFRMRAWRLNPRDSLNAIYPPSSEVPVKPHDLSVGGMRTLVQLLANSPAKLAQGTRLRVEIAFSEKAVMLEGAVRMTTRDAISGGQLIGVQFVGRPNDVKWNQMRQKLSLMVGELQRHELRLLWDGLEEAA